MLEGETVEMPMITFHDPNQKGALPILPTDLWVQRDVLLGGVDIVGTWGGGGEVHTGCQAFLDDLPDGFTVHSETVRLVSCIRIPTAPILDVMANPVFALVTRPLMGQTISLDVTDARDGSPLGWSASINGTDVTLQNDSGSPGDQIVLQIDVDAVSAAPGFFLASLIETNEVALNNPVLVPVALRK